MLQTLKTKLSSRKFWVALLGIGINITGAVASEHAAVQLACTITGSVFGMAYMLIEGKCDWESIRAGAVTIINALEEYTEETGESK